MQCFNHPNITCRTEYPEGSVQSVCPKCSWRSSKVKIPDKIPPVQAVSLVNRLESNIFDTIYINNESRVESMTQNWLPIEVDMCCLTCLEEPADCTCPEVE